MMTFKQFAEKLETIPASTAWYPADLGEADAVKSMHGEFSIKDIQKRCPAVGIDLIRRILRQEREAIRLECLGRGPGASWRIKRG